MENNVFSAVNAEKYGVENPFMLTDYQSYLELKEKIDFNLLLDIAHLKVSASRLNLNFKEQLTWMTAESNYIHISDNDGIRDSNLALQRNGEIHKGLIDTSLEDVTFTIEVYDSLRAIATTYGILADAVKLGTSNKE